MKHFFLIILLLTSFSFSVHAQQEELVSPQKTVAKNSLKTTILSIFSGSLKLTYERYLFKNQSAEVTFGVIGPAFDIIKHSDPKGLLGRLAYKFIFAPTNSSLLKGWYVKPELAFSSYTYTHPKLQRLHVDRLAIMGCGGYQFVMKWFVLDIFAGLGLGVGNANESNYHHGYIGLNSNSLLAFTAGFKVGAAF